MLSLRFDTAKELNQTLTTCFKTLFNTDEKFIPQVDEKEANLLNAFEDLMDVENPSTGKTNGDMLFQGFKKAVADYDAAENKVDIFEAILHHPASLFLFIVDEDDDDQLEAIDLLYHAAKKKNDYITMNMLLKLAEDHEQPDIAAKNELQMNEIIHAHLVSLFEKEQVALSHEEKVELKKIIDSLSYGDLSKYLKQCFIFKTEVLRVDKLFAYAVQSPSYRDADNNALFLDFMIKKGIKIPADKHAEILAKILEYGSPGALDKLIKHGLDVNVVVDAKTGDTALMTYANAKSKDLFAQGVNKACAIYRTLLESKADPLVKNKNGDNVLSLASRNLHVNALLLLLDAYPDIPLADRTNALFTAIESFFNRDKSELKTPLDTYVSNMYFSSFLRILVKSGVDINTKTSDGATLLHHAVARKDDDAVKILLQNGANPSIKNKDGKTVVNIIPQDAESRLFRMLVTTSLKRADLFDVKNVDWGKGTLYTAANTSTPSKNPFPGLALQLVNTAISGFLGEEDKKSARAVNKDLKERVKLVSEHQVNEFLRFIIENYHDDFKIAEDKTVSGYDLESMNTTALVDILRKCKVAIADENLSDPVKLYSHLFKLYQERLESLLFKLSNQGSSSTPGVLEFYFKGLAVNVKEKKSADKKDEKEAGEEKSFLQRLFSSSLVTQKSTSTAIAMLDQGFKFDFDQPIDTWRDHPPFLIHVVVGDFNVPLFKSIIQHGADINKRDEQGNTPLMLAVSRTAFYAEGALETNEMINILLARDAKLDVRNTHGRTAWMLAIENANGLAIRDFLRFAKKGMNIGLQDTDQAILNLIKKEVQKQFDQEYASLRSSDIFTKLSAVVFSPLQHHKINFNVQDEKGETSLMYAIRLKDFNLANFLLDHGADPALKNKEGLSAKDMMQEFDDKSLFARLAQGKQADLKDEKGTSPVGEAGFFAGKELPQAQVQAGVRQHIRRDSKGHF